MNGLLYLIYFTYVNILNNPVFTMEQSTTKNKAAILLKYSCFDNMDY